MRVIDGDGIRRELETGRRRRRPDLELYPKDRSGTSTDRLTKATEPIWIRQPPTTATEAAAAPTNEGATVIQQTVTNDKAPVNRGLRAITVRLDQPTRERINRRVPTDYRTLSALVRAGIAEVLERRESAGRRTDR
jgi:hypothetical protein